MPSGGASKFVSLIAQAKGTIGQADLEPEAQRYADPLSRIDAALKEIATSERQYQAAAEQNFAMVPAGMGGASQSPPMAPGQTNPTVPPIDREAFGQQAPAFAPNWR